LGRISIYSSTFDGTTNISGIGMISIKRLCEDCEGFWEEIVKKLLKFKLGIKPGIEG